VGGEAVVERSSRIAGHAEAPPRVLYSFPHKIGAARICTTAWYEAAEAAAAGATMTVYPGAVQLPLPAGITVRPTLARGNVRIPYRALGRRRALALHDLVVARRLPALAGEVDVVHTWPLGARRTLEVARRLGLVTVLERPNAHTRFAYTVVREECERLGVSLPPDHEHAYSADILRHEEEEYALADFLLCPSDFVVKTFEAEGFPAAKLLRHTYGYDPAVFYPADARPAGPGLTVLFAGAAAVRKGLHYGLEAWLRSPASADGTFLIAGSFLPDYRDSLARLLDHPSVRVLGHRSDVAELMRAADVLLLPSIEEGSALVCSEAMGCGCVPVVSDASSAFCRHLENALVHRARDVETLTGHITLLHEDRALLARLRAGALATAPLATWQKAGENLVAAYSTALSIRAAGATSQRVPERAP
jgi:glycosyltransferase involved in cell wall biosynthesis